MTRPLRSPRRSSSEPVEPQGFLDVWVELHCSGPAHLLTVIADALSLSIDQLLGHKPVTARKAPINQRLLRELRRVEKLPPHARRSVLDHIDGLLAKYDAHG